MLDKPLNLINRHLVLILCSIFLLRLAYVFNNGLDLIGDESYYWDWSRRPDWCYYSKPPMVAWLIGVFTWVGGDFTGVVRTTAVVLGTVFLGYLYATTKAFYSPKAAALAVALVLAMPFNVLANFIMTIDPPLYCFWVMSLYYLHKALFQHQNSAWLWAGVTTAAAILSKQVALFIPVMLVCFLLADRQRHLYFKKEFLGFMLPVLISLIMILLWNQQHEWVMFGHSKGHFGNKETLTLANWFGQTTAFLLYQLLLVTPVFFYLIFRISLHLAPRFTQSKPEEQFLFLIGPALVLGILVLGFVQKVQGNWPMPFYISAIILLCGQICAGSWQKSAKIGLLVGYLMVSLTYALPVLIKVFHLQNTAVDPTSRFGQWTGLGQSIQNVRLDGLPELNNTLVIALGHRFLASQLAFYLPDQPTVYRFDDSGIISSQYEVWGPPKNALGKSAFIVSEQSLIKIPATLKSAFLNFKEVGTVPNPTDKASVYHLYVGDTLLAWPNPITQNGN